MERDLTELESTNDRLDRENKSLQKEVRIIITLLQQFFSQPLTDCVSGQIDFIYSRKKSVKCIAGVLSLFLCLTKVTRLRNAMEVKDGLIDDAASKISTQERDIKRLNKDVEQFRTSDNRYLFNIVTQCYFFSFFHKSI